MKRNIAILGATGVVGRTALKIMAERGLLEHEVSLFASKKSAGKSIYINGKRHRVKELTSEHLLRGRFDYALLCTRENISAIYVPLLDELGVKVIDFSALYRHEKPLIVPEINMDTAEGNILCNPNCSTIAAVMSLYEIHKTFGIKKIVYSTYQAVSGAGKLALEDMKVTNSHNLKKLDYPISNNLIPYIGRLDDHGYSTEENKMIFETRKILRDNRISIAATCVRVPIDISHSISIYFQTRKPATVHEIIDTLKRTAGVRIVDFPMPLFVKGQDDVLVGRIRACEERNSFQLFVCSDNLRKGAAQNGVQILEELLRREL